MLFVLASGSASRKMLLRTIGFTPDVCVPTDIDETPRKKEKPRLLAARLAFEKSVSAIQTIVSEKTLCLDGGAVVLSADNVTAIGNRVVDKALTDDDVRAYMKMLSGRNHVTYSSVCITKIDSSGNVLHRISKTGITRTKFKNLSNLDIEELVNSKTGIGASGGYKVDGLGEAFIISTTGSPHSSVMGLPLYLVRNALLTMGLCSCFKRADS